MADTVEKFIEKIWILNIYGKQKEITGFWNSIPTLKLSLDMFKSITMHPITFFSIVKYVMRRLIICFGQYDKNWLEFTDKNMTEAALHFLEYTRRYKADTSVRFHEMFPDNIFSKYVNRALLSNNELKLVLSIKLDIEDHKLVFFPICVSEKTCEECWPEMYSKATTEVPFEDEKFKNFFEQLILFDVFLNDQTTSQLFDFYEKIEKMYEFDYKIKDMK